jgi:serine protease Do
MMARARWFGAVAVASLLLIAGCSGNSSGGDDTTTTTDDRIETSTTVTTTTEAISTTTTAAASGAVSDLEGVRAAVVRIVGEGSFVDPEVGEVYNQSGTGSGFIIDPSGLAVTNNHVVTGAAFLRVYVEGEEEPRNAKVLGVSECSDLAVIDIDGDGFPYLDWYEGAIATGTDVYVAGYPLGDPEYTLTEGIVAKEQADGDTNWASLDHVIEHTARMLPGNSGGPLVTPDGAVLGVNYAAAQDIDYHFTISRDEVSEILPTLIAGENVASIGVNGTAFAGEDLSGIWVSAVESGSPADGLGIKGGDVITTMEGLILATDGTMADYCDILRSNDPGDPMAIEVLRFSTEEVLEGTLNDDEELELAFSFATELGDDVADAGAVSYEYTEVTDDTGSLTMQVPAVWDDLDGSGWQFDGELIGQALAAAPDLESFLGTWATPGVFFGASEVLAETTEPGDFLDATEFSADCTYEGRSDYEDAAYTGAFDVWGNCAGTDTALIVVEAYPPGDLFAVVVQVQAVTEADLEALDTILQTFYVNP